MTRSWPLPQAREASTALVHLVRGRDAGYEEASRRFLASYRAKPAGAPHEFVLVLKGFDDEAARRRIEEPFAGVAARTLDVDDEGFDIGAYRAAARLLDHERVCFLNGWSEILGDDWLLKLSLNLDRPGIGMVGATGSFERMRHDRRFPPFPNVHLRSNGLLLERRRFLAAVGERAIGSKADAFLLESGPDGITRRILAGGLGVLVVGRDGRGYPPPLWTRSRTFRLGLQDNLLVADNQTRSAAAAPFARAVRERGLTWGAPGAAFSGSASARPGGRP